MVTVPPWVPCDGESALVTFLDRPLVSSGQAAGHLAIRAASRPAPGAGQAVLVDLPLTGQVARRLQDETGVELRDVSVVFSTADGTARDNASPSSTPSAPAATGPPAPGGSAAPAQAGGLLHRPIEWVAFFEATDWETGRTGSVTAAIRTSLADMYSRLAPVERVGSFNFGQLLLLSLAIVGGLFLVIQAVALVMGLALARSITGSVHELFIGTERVQRGDFTHKIAVRSRDQLGELADSFNSMTSSIEDLLRQKEEKERMEHELRIAREIQMSLLPQCPATLAGLTLAAHCVPAREVGGDYYDYLPIDDHRIGLLIADVSGKGTSAALYMAELKGLMLALSRQHSSPRALLIEANRIISRHLDTRSFITITYAVVDVTAQTLTYARAGHCPLIYVPGPYAAARDAQILTEGGMVLGLQLDTGDLFDRLLTEVTVPLGPGDLFLFYTDGLSEAMNPHGDCFGDERLGEVAHAHAGLPFDQLRERILGEIQGFVGVALQHDDMTLLLARVDNVPLVIGVL
jgi:sigma-B regulation protein RsbU (phosphoserine phosphatase)